MLMLVLVYGLNLTFYGTSAVNSVHYLACSMFLFVFVKKYSSSIVMISCTFANNVMSPNACNKPNKPTTESFLEKRILHKFFLSHAHLQILLSCESIS
jgi:hypothetical protein